MSEGGSNASFSMHGGLELKSVGSSIVTTSQAQPSLGVTLSCPILLTDNLLFIC